VTFSTWSGEAFNDPCADGITNSHKDNGDAAPGCLARFSGNRAKSGDKHIGLHPNEVGCEAWQELRPTFRGAIGEA
jgi:hypothetical protein